MREVNPQLTTQPPFEELQTTAALYALGALSTRDAQAFESRLSEAERAVAGEVAALDAVLAALTLSAAEQSPPATARQKLLARIAAEAERDPYDHAQFLNRRAAEGRWRDFGAGIEVKNFSRIRRKAL